VPQPQNENDHVDTAAQSKEDEDDEYSKYGDKSPASIVRHESIGTPETSLSKRKKSKPQKASTPGVIYLSSLPPYMKPSALRNILEQRGFVPIARIFLSPASKSNKQHSSGGKNSRQLYTEGWIEFSSKKIAKRCAETLNASTVGGKKGGYYRDDVWNMKYLKGMRWEELMAGVREEKREMEGRRDEERRVIARETKTFVEGVEEGRRREGMKRKKDRKKDADADEGAPPLAEREADVRRTWRQNEVKGKRRTQDAWETKISDDVQQVLSKIF
jgi:ESF2/ABP1 family protein